MGMALQTVFKGAVYLAFTPFATMVTLLATVWYCSETMGKPFDPPMHHDTIPQIPVFYFVQIILITNITLANQYVFQQINPCLHF